MPEKVVSLLRHNPGSVRDYQMGAREVEAPVLPHIAVPTTVGTGSEATQVTVVTNKEAGVKKSIVHPDLVPTVAVIDPLLTVNLSPRLTALTGLDALSHAMESYVSLATYPFAEACALRAIELIAKSLRQAVRQGDDVQARGDALTASYLAGVSMNGGVGAAHILAQPLSAVADVSHSVAIAILLPHVVEVNCQHTARKYARVAGILGEDVSGRSTEEAAPLCVTGLLRLYQNIRVSDTLSQHDLGEKDFPRILDVVAGSTRHIKTNPRPATDDLLSEILKRAL